MRIKTLGFLAVAASMLCGFTYGFINNEYTGKLDRVVVGMKPSDITGKIPFANITGGSLGTVTSVSGAGSVSGLTLSGTVTGSGSLTLGGAIAGFDPAGAAAAVTTTSIGAVPYLGATGDVDLGAHAASSASINITGTAGAGYVTLKGQSANPTSPAAGTLLLHSSTANGFTRMEQDNEAATNLVIGRDNVVIAKNTSGGSIAAGQPVYVMGSTGNVPNIALAKANALGTLPAIGVALDAIGNNNFGQVMKTGIISGVNTLAFSAGNSLWVSSTTAGALTNTRPATPNLVQRVGTVLVSGVGNGSIQIVTAPFVGGMESGTTSSTFTTGSGSNTADVAIGTANGLSIAGQVISLQPATNSQPGAMTAAQAIALSTALQPGSVKVGSFTRSLASASGTQIITGLGFKPSALVIIGTDASGASSNGYFDGTNAGCIYVFGATSGYATNKSIYLTEAGWAYAGAVSSLDVDGFTVAWTLAGTGAGTGTFYYQAFK